MHDDRAAAAAATCLDEGLEVGLGVLVVDADAALNGDRHGDAPAHRRDAVGDERGLGHEAGAEAALLHAVGGAADVEVDLGVAHGLADGGGLGEARGHGAAELQRDGILGPATWRAAARGCRG